MLMPQSAEDGRKSAPGGAVTYRILKSACRKTARQLVLSSLGCAQKVERIP